MKLFFPLLVKTQPQPCSEEGGQTARWAWASARAPFSLFWQRLSLRGPGCLPVPFTFHLAFPVCIQLLHTLRSRPASQGSVPRAGEEAAQQQKCIRKGKTPLPCLKSGAER